MKNPVVHFEIPADDVTRAKAFYQKTFGWEVERFPLPEGDYWVVRTIEVDKNQIPVKPGAINGGLMKRKNAGQPFMNYISVESIDAMCGTIESNGGTVILPKEEIGKDMGWLAAFKDTEGNVMGLHQNGIKRNAQTDGAK